MKYWFTILLLCVFSVVFAGEEESDITKLSGKITTAKGEPVCYGLVLLENTNYRTQSNEKGEFLLEITGVEKGKLLVYAHGYQKYQQTLTFSAEPIYLEITLDNKRVELEEFVVSAKKDNDFGISYLNSVEGAAIYASKKNEVILMNDVNANLATNNSRQVYAKVAGLNIWESDGAGIQLGIGGRGLSPNRTSNFNTRQNGYDISADALGYPESYYSPPTEAIDRIEVIRGAASLQYGTQFGGVLNFKIKSGTTEKAFEGTVRQSFGSFGLLNTFIDVGGTIGSYTYYGFVQHKQGNGWRSNSKFNSNTAYIAVNKYFSDKFKLKFEYTHMNYLAQQPGGLTDKQFEKDPRQSNRTRNWFGVNWNLGAATIDYNLSKTLLVNSRFFGLMASRKALGNLSRIDRPDQDGPRDLISGQFFNLGNETRLLKRYTIKGNLPSAWIIGGRYYHGNTTSMQGLANSGSDAVFAYSDENDLKSDYLFNNQNVAVFTENVFMLHPKVSITPGVRYEYIKTTATGNYSADVMHPLTNQIIYELDSAEEKSASRNIILAGIGGSFKPKSKLEIYVNFSQNYRAINFSDIKIVNPNFRVDPTIKDESGYNGDVGVRGKVKDFFTFDISAFYLKYNNRIGAVLRKDTVTYQNYRLRTNVGAARNIGLEMFGEVGLLKLLSKDTLPTTLSLFTNVALIDAIYTASNDASVKVGNKVELVPRYNIKTGLSFGYKKIKISYQFGYVSQQFSEATNAVEAMPSAINGEIPAYRVMDLSMSYTYKRYKLEGSVNNITNEMYFTRRAVSYPGPGIIPSDGRNFAVTLQIKI